MGIFDKLANMASGADTPENAAYQQQAKDLFNSKVENGDSYIVVGVYSESSKINIGRTLLRGGRTSTTYTYYNYLIGYKESPKELVILPIEPDYSSAEDPIKCTPETCTAKYGMNGLTLSGSALGDAKMNCIINNSKIMVDQAHGCIMSATYFKEQQPFLDFCKTFNS